ncbi:MAG: hypothetical protein JWL76_2198 [Thermoleophilia bacterium]|nr:hypothetical protein [Thermoleophilia bacterium]
MVASSDEAGSLSNASRAGRREANLRALNTRIAESQEQIATELSSPLTVLCECALADCNESIELTQEQFADLREDNIRFIVVEGHVLHEVEQVVGRGEVWVIVEKRGAAAREARRILE